MNFDYLQLIPELSDLYRFCKTAEETQKTDHDACGWNCRKALEWLVRAIYKLKDVPVGERDNLYTLTTGQPFVELVKDERLMMAVHYIRKVGNVAVHQGGITQKESFFALQNLYNVVGGVLLRLGVFKTLPPFNRELIPTKATLHVDSAEEVPEATKEFIESVSEQNITNPVPVAVPPVYSELETRKRFIDLMLREAGWEVLSQENVPFACKAGIEIYVDGMPNKKEDGYCDYVLYGRDCKPLAVVEAKRTSVEPEKGKHQAELYADCLERKYGQRPVIYYSNGFRTMIIDGLGYPPRQVMGFHTLEDLELMKSRKGRSKMTDLAIKDKITNRDYQKRAIRSVCDHLNENASPCTAGNGNRYRQNTCGHFALQRAAEKPMGEECAFPGRQNRPCASGKRQFHRTAARLHHLHPDRSKGRREEGPTDVQHLQYDDELH